MPWPSTEALKRITPFLPGEFFSPRTVSNIQRISRLLPDVLSSYYLECRLAPGAGQVDFSACILAADSGSSQLCGEDRSALPSSSLLAHPLWQRIQTFLTRWGDPASAIHDQVPLIWLEFDGAHALRRRVPLPCFSFLMDPDYLRRRTSSGFRPHSNTQRYQPFVDEALADLLGRPVPPRMRAKLETCFNALPTEGAFFYLAAMLPRGPAFLKVNGSVPHGEFKRYLREIHWRGSFTELDRLLELYEGPLDRVRFDLNFGSGLLSRIGIEFFSGFSSADENSRRAVLDRLVDVGLCDSRKRDALLAWAGDTFESFEGQPWQALLRKSWYIKLVHEPGRPLEAKGYLGFTPGAFPFTPKVRT